MQYTGCNVNDTKHSKARTGIGKPQGRYRRSWKVPTPSAHYNSQKSRNLVGGGTACRQFAPREVKFEEEEEGPIVEVARALM
jgi:hypothetical protein